MQTTTIRSATGFVPATNLRKNHDAALYTLPKTENLPLCDLAPQNQHVAGIHLQEDETGRTRMLAMLRRLKLLPYVTSHQLNAHCSLFLLQDSFAKQFLPDANTLELDRTLRSDKRIPTSDIECEIVLTMLGAPHPLAFANFEEFVSSVRTRINIVNSAQHTQLAFGTSTAERPQDCWVYQEDVGYTIIPGQPLTNALKKATQPPHPDATLYAFSCYRATEYVILHGIAQEMAVVNPGLLDQLQKLWEVRPVKSGEYHDVFLDEYGSFEQPVPIHFYIPGDRVWFRNPDAHSSNASGYEGSWVIYLGQGLFSNFWKHNQPYTFIDKCIEIYHWRHATYYDNDGELRIDESIVEKLVRETKSDATQVEEILRIMDRPRDPKDVVANGGCADITREFPKAMCMGTAKINIPECK